MLPSALMPMLVRKRVIGTGTVIHHHGNVEGRTTIGAKCEIFPFACVGTKTHDLKFKGGEPGLIVGDRNVFREYVSVHGATNDAEFTRMGNDNVILAYSHIAHDCVVGNFLVMSSQTALAGHVLVEGPCQHRVGHRHPPVLPGGFPRHARRDVENCAGRAALRALRTAIPPLRAPSIKVGLERHGFSVAQLESVKQIFPAFQCFAPVTTARRLWKSCASTPSAAHRSSNIFLAFADTSEANAALSPASSPGGGL